MPWLGGKRCCVKHSISVHAVIYEFPQCTRARAALEPPFVSPANTVNERDRVAQYWSPSTVTMQALITLIRTCTCNCVFIVTWHVLEQRTKNIIWMWTRCKSCLTWYENSVPRQHLWCPQISPITRLKSLHAVTHLKSNPDLGNKISCLQLPKLSIAFCSTS